MSTGETLRDMLAEGGIDRVYSPNKVPAKPGYPYAVLAVSPGVPQIRTLDGSGDPIGRFTVQHFGKSGDSVEDIAAISFATFDARELPLPGLPVCTQEQATAIYRDSDDNGVLTTTHIYEY